MRRGVRRHTRDPRPHSRVHDPPTCRIGAADSFHLSGLAYGWHFSEHNRISRCFPDYGRTPILWLRCPARVSEPSAINCLFSTWIVQVSVDESPHIQQFKSRGRRAVASAASVPRCVRSFRHDTPGAFTFLTSELVYSRPNSRT